MCPSLTCAERVVAADSTATAESRESFFGVSHTTPARQTARILPFPRARAGRYRWPQLVKGVSDGQDRNQDPPRREREEPDRQQGQLDPEQAQRRGRQGRRT